MNKPNSDFSSLVRFIKRKNIASYKASDSKRIIFIDKEARRSISKIPFWGSSKIASLLIFNSNDVVNYAERSNLVVEVSDFTQNHRIPLSISYRVSCVPGMEETLAIAFCNSEEDNLDRDFDQRISALVNRLLSGQIDRLIESFAESVAALQNKLSEAAYRELGLNLSARIKLYGEEELDSIPIGTPEATSFEIYVSDSDEPLILKLQTELIVDKPALAMSTQQEDIWMISLVTSVKEEIRKYFLNEVTLSQFYYELKDTVRHGLARHLDNILYSKGRKVSYLYLDSDSVEASSIPKELVEIDYSVKCRVKNFSGEVSVENTLQMIPQDVRRYISAQSPNLEAWVQNKLDKIVKPLLLGKKYIDLLINFDHESERIRASMQNEAEAIGYTIQHIVSLPALEHLALKESFEIRDSGDQFSTNETAIKVALSTSVNAKFNEFDKIEDYLNRPVQEIKTLMQEAINSKTKEILRTIDPERFYMRFYVADEQLEKVSVEKELEIEVKKVLEDRFGAKVLRVVVVTELTDIIDYLQRLMGMLGSFKCDVPSLVGGEPVTFHGDFKIRGVEKGSWYVFQSVFETTRKSQEGLRREFAALSKQHADIVRIDDVDDSQEELDRIRQRIQEIESIIFGISEIQRTIEKSIRSKLITVDPETLRFNDIRSSFTLEKFINQCARESIIEHYGLEISIRHLERNRTEQEVKLFGVQNKLEQTKSDEMLMDIESLGRKRSYQRQILNTKSESEFKELERLYEQRLKLASLSDSDDLEELEHINTRISILEENMAEPRLYELEQALNPSSIDVKGLKRTSGFKAQVDLTQNLSREEIEGASEEDKS